MAGKNILLIEPGYRNKYPPLGLINLAQNHGQEGTKDNVIFVKREDKSVLDTCWDRILVSRTKSEKPIKIITSGGSLEDPENSAKTLGGDHNGLQRIKIFRQWLAEADLKKDIKNAKEKIRDEMSYELRQIKTHSE